MKPEDDELRLAEIVLHAATLDGVERESFLRGAAIHDASLVDEARRRLADADDLADSFLETPAADHLDTTVQFGVARHEPTEPETGIPAEELSAAALPTDQRYELGETLGAGGMGQVVRAFDRQLRRTVALKFLTHEDPKILRLFLNEARAQARVEHEHVLEVYDSGELGGRPFITMHRASGGTLAEVAPALSLEEKVRLLAQAARGLDAAHRQGLLHRDVKPSNILIESADDGELRALVTDFGLAQDLTEDESALDDVAGTPRYIAPEQLSNPDAAPDRRSDVYSLGITLYRLLVGVLPWQGAATVEVLRRTIRQDLPAPRTVHPELPKELEAIILRCTDRDPAQRYATARSVAEDLERYLAGEVVEAYAAGLAYRVVRFGLRNRLLTGLALATLTVLVVSSGVIAGYAWRLDAALHRAEVRHGQAEDLIHFVLFDLREKLESLGRLDILKVADDAATEYFAAVPAEELSETELLRRSRMLYQIGDVRIRQGDLQGAAAPMAESLELARRLVDLQPDDGERLFELGQAHFWVGFVAWEQGDLAEARGPLEDYLDVSQRLVDKDPANLDWRRELAFAYSNLGSLLEAEGNLEGALGQFFATLTHFNALVAADPTPEERAELAATHNTLGVVLQSLNRLDEAEEHLRRDLEIRQELLALDPSAPRARDFLGTSYSHLGRLLFERGELPEAEEMFQAMQEVFSELIAHDPDNSGWRFKFVWSQIEVGRLACVRADRENAAALWLEAQQQIEQLLEQDSTSHHWRRTRAVTLYHLAILQATQDEAGARETARSAVEVLEGLNTERPTDRLVQRWLHWSSRFLALLDTPVTSETVATRTAEFCQAQNPSSFMSPDSGDSR